MSRYFTLKKLTKRDRLTYVEYDEEAKATFAHYDEDPNPHKGVFTLEWMEERVKAGHWVEMPMPPLHISETEFDTLCARDAFGNHPDILLARISRFMRAQQFHKIAERLEDMTATHRASLKKFLKEE